MRSLPGYGICLVSILFTADLARADNATPSVRANIITAPDGRDQAERLPAIFPLLSTLATEEKTGVTGYCFPNRYRASTPHMRGSP
jgi:hypothetical protein